MFILSKQSEMLINNYFKDEKITRLYQCTLQNGYCSIYAMKKYLTSVIAIHNVEGKLGKWPGPIIEAESFEAAQDWCLKNTQYLFVEQEIMEARKEDNADFQLN